MGLIRTPLQLVNAVDKSMAKHGFIPNERIRQMESNCLVDSGAAMMAINETIAAKLGLDVQENRKAELADGQILTLEVVGPLEIVWGNRRTVCNAVVLPGDSEPLLGAIPMQDLDLVVYYREERIGLAPDQPENMSKKSLK